MTDIVNPFAGYSDADITTGGLSTGYLDPVSEAFRSNLLTGVAGLMADPYQQYTHERIAGLTPEQEAAMTAATHATGFAPGSTATWQPEIQEATSTAQGALPYFSKLAEQTAGLYGEGADLTRSITPEAMDLMRGGIASYESMMPGAQAAMREGIGQWQDLSGEAANLMRGTTGQFERERFDPSSGIAAYMSPHTQSVKGAAFADIDEAQAQGLNQLRADTAAQGAFGGARHGLAEGQVIGEALKQKSRIGSELDQANYAQALQASMGEHAAQQASGQQAYEAQRLGQVGAASGLAGLGQTGAGIWGQYGSGLEGIGARGSDVYSRAASGLGQLGTSASGLYGQFGAGLGALGESGAGIAQRGAGQMAGIGSLKHQLGTSDIGTMMNIGGIHQGIEQQKLSQDYADWQAMKKHPYEQYGFGSNIFTGTPMSKSTMTTAYQPQASGAASTLGNLATAASMFTGGADNVYSQALAP